MSGHPAAVLDALAAAGEEPGGAVAVVRNGAVEIDHCVGTSDGTTPWTSLGRDLWRAYVQPAVTGHDLVLDRTVTWTLGFQIAEENGRVDLGMVGAGGCSAWADPAAGYGAAVLTRGLGGHDRADAVWEAITATFPPPAR